MQEALDLSFDRLLMMMMMIYTGLYLPKVARGSADRLGTALLAGSSRFRYPMGPPRFFIDLIFPAAFWPWVGSASDRNEYRTVKAASA